MSKFFVNKIFIELIYSETLLFNDMRTLNEISEILKDTFPETNYDDIQKNLILSNSEKQYMITLNKNRLGIDVNSPISFLDFKEISNRVMSTVIETLKIKNVIRLGMRTFRGIEKRNNGEAYKSVWKNFIKIKEEDLKDLGLIQGCGVNFTLRGEKYNINLGISPNFYQILKIVNGKIEDQANKWQFMVDSDVYLDSNISIENVLNSFVEDVISINENKIDEFINKESIY